MKKLITILLISILALSSCSPQPDNSDIGYTDGKENINNRDDNEDSEHQNNQGTKDDKNTDDENKKNTGEEESTKPNIESIVTTFKDRLFAETDRNNKVKNFSTKEELVEYISEVADKELVRDYVDMYYKEREDGLYIIPKDSPLLLYLDTNYKVEKKDNKYYAIQHNKTALHGEYTLTMTFAYENDRWIIKDVMVDRENGGKESPIDPKKQEESMEKYRRHNSLLVLVSKSNRLPRDYVPNDLVKPDIPFTFKEDLPRQYMRPEASIAIEKLFREALRDDIKFYGISAYRSYDRQERIFNANVEKYGEEKTSTFIARPGASEHQTGLAIDVTTRDVNFQITTKLGDTEAGIWLENNAHDFGFIIRYPKGKEDITGYMYEPWHLRYVGEEVAHEIVNNNLVFEKYINRQRRDTN